MGLVARRSRFPKALRGKAAVNPQPVKYWEIIADNLNKAGWSLGWVSAIDSTRSLIPWLLYCKQHQPEARCDVGNEHRWKTDVPEHRAVFREDQFSKIQSYPDY